MNTSQSQSNKEQTRAQAQVSTPASKAKTIKPGIDAHLDRYVVVRISCPQTVTSLVTNAVTPFVYET
jgi:hypothetical protein